jgi:DNA-binding HxlR family transcriptional regulator
MATPPSSPSSLDRTLSRVGDRWTLLIVEALLGGPQRFADIQGAVPGIATNVLSARLKHLEADGLVLAHPYSTRPVRYAYDLTHAGQGLADAVRVLTQWGADHGAAGESEAPVHAPCGSALRARWWCPTCEEVADVDDEAPVWM